MYVEVFMPRLGQSMEEGRVLRWRKSVGDRIGRGEVIAEIETDKAAVEMESTVSGVLMKLAVPEGELVPVGTPIAVVDDGRPIGEAINETEVMSGPPSTSGGQIEVSSAALHSATEHEPHRPNSDAIHLEKRLNRGKVESPPSQRGAKQAKVVPMRLNISPVARQLADQHGVDLGQVEGTGPGGRIVRGDVEAWLEAHRQQAPQVGEISGVTQVALTKIKLTTARRMSESKATVPHFYVAADIRMDQALSLRESLKARGVEISINDLILRATTLALMKYPHLNARFAGDKLLLNAHVNLSVAVALDEGLITPVIHNCETLSLAELASAARGIVERARAGHLRTEDLEEGTFTVSNLGPFGVTTFHAIVNPPQAAILAVGGVHRVAVFDPSDRLIPAHSMSATVSADHRVTDGAEVARFLQELKRILEDASELIQNPREPHG